MSTSHSAPDATILSQPPSKPSRRHSRLHSRNLSIFFPRPGSTTQASISEDGSQEIEVRVDEEAPITTIPSASPNFNVPGSRRGNRPTSLGAGFTFGGLRPLSTGGGSPELITVPTPNSATTARRGHHHKHSMSHNFFSFLEPGANGRPPSPKNEELHTQPAPVPISPWTPMSGFPQSARSTTTSFSSQVPNGRRQSIESDSRSSYDGSQLSDGLPDTVGRRGASVAGIMQFVLGAWLWVCGQQIGSLSVTGLGYWVVFDSFGLGLVHFRSLWLRELRATLKLEGQRNKERIQIRRPYG
jgi:hypothetical protein